jgi:hypothetical protein
MAARVVWAEIVIAALLIRPTAGQSTSRASVSSTGVEANDASLTPALSQNE